MRSSAPVTIYIRTGIVNQMNKTVGKASSVYPCSNKHLGHYYATFAIGDLELSTRYLMYAFSDSIWVF